MGRFDNVYEEFFRLVREACEEGYGVTAVALARDYECDTETARRKLNDLCELGMLEAIKAGPALLYRLPGYNVMRSKQYERNGTRPIKTYLTPEELDTFMDGIKRGTEIKYASDYPDGDTGVHEVKKVTVVKRYKHVVLLSNGHSCLPIDIYNYLKHGVPIGVQWREKDG